MSFLELNGIEVPVLDSGSERHHLEFGEGGGTLSGSYEKTRRAFRRRWKFRTPILSHAVALALREVIVGRGAAFPFDASLRGSGGLVPLSSVATLHYPMAGGGVPVREAAHSPGQVWVGGAVGVDEASANILPASTALADNTGSFVSIDGSVLTLQAPSWRPSSSSVVVTTPAGTNGTLAGVRSVAATAISGTVYRGSVYVRPISGAMVLRAYLRDEVNGITGGAVTRTCPVNEWTRFTGLALVAGAGSPTVSLYVTEETETAAAEVFQIGGLQVEAKAHTTSWLPGATARAAGDLNYGASALRALTGDMTLSAFATRPRGGAGINRYLFSLRSTGGITLYPLIEIRVGTTGTLSALIGDNNAIVTTVSVANYFVAFDTFVLVSLIIRTNPQAGEFKVELYRDGLLVGSASPANLPNFGTLGASLRIGSNGTANQEWSGGHIDDAMVLPYALSPSILLDWVAAGASVPRATYPFLVAKGSFFSGREVKVKGLLEDMPFEPFHGGAAGFNDDGRSISFVLEEA